MEDEDLTNAESINGTEGHSGGDRASWPMPKEQIQQWKRNRRALVFTNSHSSAALPYFQVIIVSACKNNVLYSCSFLIDQSMVSP